MAHSYFSPRPARQRSFSEMQSADDDLAGDLEQSIFIFPSPRTESDPPSPFSIPTDVSFPSTTTTERRGRRTSSVSGVSEWATVSGRSMSTDTALRSPLIEVWEMSDEADGEVLPGHATPGPTLHSPLHRQQQRFPLGRHPFPTSFVFSDGRLHLRARKESIISPIDSKNKSNTDSLSTSDSERSSIKRIITARLPLLAFLSSLLSIEDTTLHLLTRPSHPHTSALFPGPRLLSEPIIEGDAIIDEKRALFASSTSLLTGIDVAADPSVTLDSIFALPLPHLPFTYIWNFVSDVCKTTAPRVRLQARAA